jgi:RNA 3'-terminal phosphate cyclase
MRGECGWAELGWSGVRVVWNGVEWGGWRSLLSDMTCLPWLLPQVASISVSAYSSGKASHGNAERMVAEAQKRLRAFLGTEVEILASAVRETAESAVGDGESWRLGSTLWVCHWGREAISLPSPSRPFPLPGCGISLVARTSTGCLLGSTARGQARVSPESVAAEAVKELREALDSGACVDQW